MKLYVIPINRTISTKLKLTSKSTPLLILHHKPTHRPPPPTPTDHDTTLTHIQYRIQRFARNTQAEALQWLEKSNPDHPAHKSSTAPPPPPSPIRQYLRTQIHRAYTYILENTDSNETALKLIRSAYAHDEHIHVYYPNHITTHDTTHQQLTAYAQHHARRTTIYTVLSFACLPVTIAMSVLPGPNVFAAYNIWRVWSYYTCAVASLNMYNMLSVQYDRTDNDTAVETDEEMKRHGRQVTLNEQDELGRIVTEWYNQAEHNLTNLAVQPADTAGTSDTELTTQPDITANRFGFTAEQLESLCKMTKLSMEELQQYIRRWHLK